MRLKSNSCEQGWGDVSRVGTFQAKRKHKAPAQLASTKRKPKWGRRVPRRYMPIIITDVYNISRRGTRRPQLSLRFMLAFRAKAYQLGSASSPSFLKRFFTIFISINDVLCSLRCEPR